MKPRSTFTKSEATFGLDIGFETIKMVQIGRKGGKVSLVGAIEIPLKDRIIEHDKFKNKADTANQIKEAMRNAKPYPIEARKIVSCLPENFVFTKTIRLPKMSKAEYRTAVPNKSAEFLPLPLEEVYLDFQVLMSHPDEKLCDIFIAAAPKKLVDDYMEMAGLAGLELIALETKPFSVGRAILLDFHDPGLAVVHIGTEYSRISIWDNNNLRLSSTVSAGRNQILQALGQVRGSGVDPKISTEHYGSIASTMSAIVNELLAAIKYHQSRSYKPKPIGKVILCGSGAGISGLDKYIATETKIETVAASIQLGKTILPPQFIAAYGLALRDENE